MSRWVSGLPPFARRALQVDQMEFDSALSQMYSLCVKPSLVSKMSKARKMTKNHYHRDDPAFMVLQVLFIALSTVAYGLTCGSTTQTLLSIVYEVLVNYLVVGVVISSITWVIVNRFFLGTGHFGDVKAETDWQYSFDVHCNGFFTYFMWTKVAPFVLFPIVVQRDSFVPQVIGNGLYLFGLTSYAHNVFLGYLELPMLTQQQRLTYPVPVAALLIVIITLFTSINISAWSINSNWP